MAVRITQVAVETSIQPNDGKVRVTQVAVETTIAYSHASLVGAALTATRGAITVSGVVSAVLGGQATTSAAGSITADGTRSALPSGAALTAARGTLSATGTLSLTGRSLTMVNVWPVGGAGAAPDGQSLSAVQGQPFAVASALSSAAMTIARGSLATESDTSSVAGRTATVGVGAPKGGTAVPMDGAALSTGTGTMTTFSSGVSSAML